MKTLPMAQAEPQHCLAPAGSGQQIQGLLEIREETREIAQPSLGLESTRAQHRQPG